MQLDSLQVLNLLVHSQLCLHPHSSLRGAFWGKLTINTNSITFEGNKRRSNLPSLNNWQEFFDSCKTTPFQNKSKEIASWIEKRFTELMLNATQTETRNDKLLDNQRKLQFLQKGNVCGY